MPTIDLNILQERELARLLDYERATCTVDGDLVYHCAFPYRPDDDLQVELIAHGALMQKIDNDISVQQELHASHITSCPSNEGAPPSPLP